MHVATSSIPSQADRAGAKRTPHVAPPRVPSIRTSARLLPFATSVPKTDAMTITRSAAHTTQEMSASLIGVPQLAVPDRMVQTDRGQASAPARHLISCRHVTNTRRQSFVERARERLLRRLRRRDATRAFQPRPALWALRLLQAGEYLRRLLTTPTGRVELSQGRLPGRGVRKGILGGQTLTVPSKSEARAIVPVALIDRGFNGESELLNSCALT